jgi:hypothetical protein
LSHHFDGLDGKKTNKEKMEKRNNKRTFSDSRRSPQGRGSEWKSGARGRYPVCIVVLGLGLSRRFVEELNIVVAVGWARPAEQCLGLGADDNVGWCAMAELLGLMLGCELENEFESSV